MAEAEGGEGRGVEDEEGGLPEVLTSLRPFLAKLGLKPSRVVTFMLDTGGTDQLPQFPSREVLRRILLDEKRDETGQMAALSFLEMLLSPQAPPSALPVFLEALFTANHDPQHLNPNRGAWRVHDVLRLSCAYLPLQRALERQASGQEDPGAPQVNVQGVVTRLSERRLLDPDLSPLVLETWQLDGPQSALTCLLACVHATGVDMLRDELESWLADLKSGAGVPLEVPGGGDSSPIWLRGVVEAVEASGGEGFGQLVPDSVFSPHTWSRVYDQLAYGRRGRIHQDEACGGDTDTQSEAGKSAVTLLAGNDDSNDDTGAVAAPQRSKEEDYRRNMEQRTRQHRTRDFVLGICSDQGLEIPFIMENIHYEFQKLRGELDRPPSPSLSELAGAADDMDDSVSVRSQSTEANSHVPDMEDSSNSSSSIRLRLMRDISGSLRVSKQGQIELRSYQNEVLYWARQRCNVAIFLPTGTGKTFVVLRYMQEHLSASEVRRVVFLAPKVKLAEQQFHRFSEFFPHTTYFRCGRHRSSNAPFSELLETFKVYVMTPQCLVEALERKEVQMTDFSLLVLDECHNVGRGKHSFRILMETYLNVKLSPQALPNNGTLPQVIGLTASPGVGNLGSLEGAVSHIRQLCYAMNVERICTVKENTEELKFFISEPKHQIHTCGRRKKDGFRKIIEELMAQTEQAMLLCVDSERQLTDEEQQALQAIVTGPVLHRVRPMYLHWASNLQDKFTAFTHCPDTYRTLFSMAEMLIMCQRVLMLNEDSDSVYAMEFLQSQLSTLEDQVPHTPYSSQERRLLDRFNYRIPELHAACEDPEDYNPKLRMLEEILLAVMEKNQEACACMVFVRSLELTRAIQSWIERHPQLKSLNPGRITGLQKSVNKGGMKRQEISDVMANFNLGEHKLVVCTSAAEEGLDFQACNLVVRYDYVTSMISMIQTRGRARRMESQYCLVGGLSHANVTKEQENQAWERLMTKAIEQVQQDMDGNPNGFLEAMAVWQKADHQVRQQRQQAALEKEQQRIYNSAVYRLLCRKCQRFVCLSTDFRLVCQSSRAVVAAGFETKWKRVERGDVKQIKEVLEKVAKVHCRAANCGFDWGILARYKPTGRLLPVLKIESFFLVDCATDQQLKTKFKWSQAPFYVPDISEQELAA